MSVGSILGWSAGRKVAGMHVVALLGLHSECRDEAAAFYAHRMSILLTVPNIKWFREHLNDDHPNKW